MLQRKIRSPYIKAALCAFAVLAALLLLWRVLDSMGDIQQWLRQMAGLLYGALRPFIIGVIAAYLLEPFVRAAARLLAALGLEARLGARRCRAVSVATVYVLLCGALTLLITRVLPDVFASAGNFVQEVPGYYQAVSDIIEEKVFAHPLLANAQVRAFVDAQLEQVSQWINQSAQALFAQALRALQSVGSGIVNTFFGLIVALYVLLDRPALTRAARALLCAALGRARTARVERLARDVDLAFGRYISAVIVQSVILAGMTYVGLAIIHLPYALLLAVLVGFLNVIPYFGATLSTLLCLLVAFFKSPASALYTILFLTVVQTVDNWVVTPWLFGDKMGLKPIWIIFGVLVGGALFGMWGMILGVPTLSVVRVLLQRAEHRRGRTHPACVEARAQPQEAGSTPEAHPRGQSAPSAGRRKFI
nr:AI-2E family transporter [Maliibacterium massiliense]